MDNRDVEDVELAERLEAYARARLSPSAAVSARIRLQVLTAAHRQAALMASTSELPARARLIPMPRWRGPVAALLAAGLTLALAVGTVAAAQPGGPLYQTRIWAETLTLPSTASERAAAEVRRMNERLAEIAAAVASGNANAEAAALAAYNQILGQATADAAGKPEATKALDAGVRNNVIVLTQLLDKVPPQARDAIEHAIQNSESTSNSLSGAPTVNPGGNTPNGPHNGLGPSSAPGQSNKPEHTANPNKPTSKPAAPPQPDAATQRPHPTPKPKPTPQAPASTSRPEHTPRVGG